MVFPKFNGPWLSYGVSMCIRTSDIVWFNGLFLCKKVNNMQFFESRLKNKLDTKEKVEEDMEHQGMIPKVQHPCVYISLTNKKVNDRACARHKTVNGRITKILCLPKTFHHNIKNIRVCLLSPLQLYNYTLTMVKTHFKSFTRLNNLL